MDDPYEAAASAARASWVEDERVDEARREAYDEGYKRGIGVGVWMAYERVWLRGVSNASECVQCGQRVCECGGVGRQSSESSSSSEGK